MTKLGGEKGNKDMSKGGKQEMKSVREQTGFVQGAKDVESLLWHAVLADKLRELCRTSSSEHDKLFGTRVEPP